MVFVGVSSLDILTVRIYFGVSVEHFSGMQVGVVPGHFSSATLGRFIACGCSGEAVTGFEPAEVSRFSAEFEVADAARGAGIGTALTEDGEAQGSIGE